ncbi:uncharacterized protein LOC135378564 isoform X2 [Ornithodoros turicata]|uniref:uncharacterized protein LOC135378564 isoform X2 n=1 Tax=Ornithodoros turicata TaxID=34597 RepID=UPI0031387A71
MPLYKFFLFLDARMAEGSLVFVKEEPVDAEFPDSQGGHRNDEEHQMGPRTLFAAAMSIGKHSQSHSVSVPVSETIVRTIHAAVADDPICVKEEPEDTSLSALSDYHGCNEEFITDDYPEMDASDSIHIKREPQDTTSLFVLPGEYGNREEPMTDNCTVIATKAKWNSLHSAFARKQRKDEAKRSGGGQPYVSSRAHFKRVGCTLAGNPRGTSYWSLDVDTLQEYDALTPTPAVQPSQALSQREKQANARTAHNKSLQEILQRGTSQEEFVPKRLLEESQEEAAKLREELEETKRQLQRQRDICDRLQDTLLDKIDAVFQAQRNCTCNGARADASVQPATFANLRTALRCISSDCMYNEEQQQQHSGVHLTPEHPAASRIEETSVSEDAVAGHQSAASPGNCLDWGGATTVMAEAQCAQVRGADAAVVDPPSTPALAVTVGTTGLSAQAQRDLENGEQIPSEKLAHAMGSTSDSIFVRQIARALWTPEELRGRSVTGRPCQRFLKQGVSGKRALTPKKLAALKSCFREYAARKPCRKGRSLTERIDSVNSYLADFLKKMCKNKKNYIEGFPLHDL